jgi:hypothetical protein
MSASQQKPEQPGPEAKDKAPPEVDPLKAPEVDPLKAPEVEPLKGDESDAEIANRLSAIIDSANERIKPLLELMKQV